MLTPEYLDTCVDYLLGMYDSLQEAIAQDIARRLIKTGKITDTAAYQAKQLQESGALMQNVIKMVAYISEYTDDEIARLFDEAGVTSMRNDADPLLKAGYDVDLKLSPAMSQHLQAAIVKTQGDMRNLTLTTGSTATNLYVEASNMAYMKVASGGFTYYEAISEAIRQAAKDGNYVSYASGARSRLDVAVRRSVLTGVNQTCGKLTELYSADMDAEYYEVTAHHGARPSHAVWQGRVYKIKGTAPGYDNFYDATGYGTGDGLCGWNCRHSFYPYWPGISSPAYTRETLDRYDAAKYSYGGEKLTDYECSQIQRKYEREIRESKRILSSHDAAIKATKDQKIINVLEGKFQKESVRLKSKEAEMKEFCRQTNRKPDSKRTQVVAYKDGSGNIVNFGRSTSIKAVWANRKNVYKTY